MNKFANLWPDDLGIEEAKRDLGYEPKFDISGMVKTVLDAHEDRNVATAKAFKAMDVEGDNQLDRLEVRGAKLGGKKFESTLDTPRELD